ncbi:hypothetical protein BDQ17DRAFT_1329875 [Cyathus striatus]|nr:hypothetical protein BDQ17DRAFT_1329875 [Cyathus striatus]
MKRAFHIRNVKDEPSSAKISPTSVDILSNLEQDVVISGFNQILINPVTYLPILEGHPPTKTDYPPSTIICTRIPSLTDPHGITQCILPLDLKSHILSIPDFPLAPPNPSQQEVYRVAPTQSKGLGLFAMSTIEIGQLILAERPLLIVPCDTAFNVSDIHTISRHSSECMKSALSGALVKLLVLSMPEENNRSFFELCNSHPDDWEGVVHGTFRTNAVDVKITACDMRFKGVMKTMARVNHSCCPNAVYHFDLPTFSIHLHAIRQISPGDEITISYVPLESTASDRAVHLTKHYAIPPCRSTCCTNPSSDTLRTSISSKAQALQSRMYETCTRIEKTLQCVLVTNLNITDTPDEMDNIRKTYLAAKALVCDMKRFGIEGCMSNPGAGMRVVDDKVRRFRVFAGKVVRALLGERAEEFRVLMLENEMFGIV